MSQKLTKVVSTACYILFSYQFYSVTHDYLQYKTSTKVEALLGEEVSPPALTIGFKTPIPIFELFSKVFPNATYPYKKAGLDAPWKNSALGQKCDECFNSLDWQNIPETKHKYTWLWHCFLTYFGDRPVQEYFQDLPEFFGKLIEYGSNDNLTGFADLDRHENASYSIGFWGNVGVTVFGNLPSQARLRPDANLFVKYDYAKVQPFSDWLNYVQIHSAKSVPHYSKIQVLDAVNDQVLFYHSVLIVRLPPPYDTHCHDYRTSPPDGVQSQIQCVANCVFRSYLETNSNFTTFNYYFRFWNYFVKAGQFPQKAKMSDLIKDRFASVHVTKTEFEKTQFFCEKQCPIACEETAFNWIVLSSPRMHYFDNIYIELTHQFENDQLYTYQAAFDWMTYLCNVGGLAGMWIGVSIQSVSIDLFSLAGLRLKYQAFKQLIAEKFNFLNRFFQKQKPRQIDVFVKSQTNIY